MPFFSIIIPSYNRSEFLTDTISSVINQSFEDWECIIIDDGSTDDTFYKISEIISEEQRVRYIYQENSERSVARNNGIKHSKGNYICFLDSDDYYEQNYLEKLYAKIEETKFDVAIFVTNFSIWNGNALFNYETPLIDKANLGNWFFINPVSPTRVSINRLIFDKYKFREDILIVEDTVLWVSIINEFGCYQIEDHLVRYRVHDSNSVAKGSTSSFNRYEGLNKFFKSELSSIVSKRVKKRMISDCLYRMAEYSVEHKNKFNAIKYSVLSILVDLSNHQRKMKVLFFLNLIPGFKYLKKTR